MMNSLSYERTGRNEAISLTVAAGLHVLALIWNPVLLKSDFKQIKDFVSVELVDQGGGSPVIADAPKQSIFSSLKDMLLTPKSDQLANVAPQQPVRQVAAPQQPMLQDKARRPMQMTFQPKNQQDDLASLKDPDAIKAPGPKIPDQAVGGPTLQSKSFGGIRSKDLPFKVSTGETINSGDSSNIPIAMGNASAKSGLGYTGPTLQDSSKRRAGLTPGLSGTGASPDTMALASAGAAPIATGTGGTGNAPTGAMTGSGSLQQRSGRGGWGGGTGTGIGRGIGSGVEGGMPGAAQELDAQLAKGSGSDKTAKRKGFNLEGPLTNRPIVHKVIPQYPAWAEEQGIMGSVRLYFTVDGSGNVRSNIRVTKTTGYPALDQLGIDALKQWKFAPLSSDEEGKGQWGILTFNFSLSS